MVLLHFLFLFECSSEKKPGYSICFAFFTWCPLIFSLRLLLNETKNTMFSFCFRFFKSLPNIFPSISPQTFSFLIYFTLNFGFCFVPGAVVVYDVLVVFDVAVDCRPSVFDALKSLESLLFCAANLWKLTCSYCSTSYLFYTDINCNRSIDLTKDGYPFMPVQIKSNHIVLYSSAQWNSG